MARPVGSQNPRRPYAEAKDFVHTLNLSNATEWWTWSKSGQRPPDIPGNPRQYREEFTDWYDWLGNARPVNQRLAKREQRRAEHSALEKKSKAEPREKKLKAEEPIREPASIEYQLAKFKQEHPEWSGHISLGDTEAKGKSKARVSAQAQKGALKKCTCKIKLVWTSCKGSGTHSAVRGDSFRKRQKAEAAVAEYRACHGWTPFIGLCELCSVFHLFRDRPLAT